MSVDTLARQYGDTRMKGEIYWGSYWREYYMVLDVNIGGTPGLVEVLTVKMCSDHGVKWTRVQHMTPLRDDDKLVDRLDISRDRVNTPGYEDEVIQEIIDLIDRAGRPIQPEWANCTHR